MGGRSQFLGGMSGKIGLSEKKANFPGFRRGISPICPRKIRTSPVHFSDAQFAHNDPQLIVEQLLGSVRIKRVA